MRVRFNLRTLFDSHLKIAQACQCMSIYSTPSLRNECGYMNTLLAWFVYEFVIQRRVESTTRLEV